MSGGANGWLCGIWAAPLGGRGGRKEGSVERVEWKGWDEIGKVGIGRERRGRDGKRKGWGGGKWNEAGREGGEGMESFFQSIQSFIHSGIRVERDEKEREEKKGRSEKERTDWKGVTG